MTQQGAANEVNQDAQGNAPWIEGFIPGTHTDSSGRKMTFTERHLQDAAESYDPAVHEAPVVVGHPKTDDPALGWIAAVKVEGGKLMYQERDVNPEFAQMRDAGAYKKRSFSFYLPDSPGNPTPGKLHIRHVGWLGAMPPAIKGMADAAKRGFKPAFSDDDGEGVVEFNDMEFADAPAWSLSSIADAFARIRDYFVEQVGLEKADQIVPRYQIDSIREAGLTAQARGCDDDNELSPGYSEEEQQAMSDQQKQLDEQRAEIEKREKELADKEAQFNEQQAKAEAEERRENAVHFADQLVNGGKLAPASRDAVVELLVITDAAQPVNFGEGDDAQERAPGELLRELLNAQPNKLDFSEKGGGNGRAAAPADFSAPAGAAIDGDGLSQLAAAQAYMKANPGTTLIDAAKAVQSAG